MSSLPPCIWARLPNGIIDSVVSILNGMKNFTPSCGIPVHYQSNQRDDTIQSNIPRNSRFYPVPDYNSDDNNTNNTDRVTGMEFG